MDIAELFDRAIKTEEDAYEFYLKFSKIVKNPAAKDLLKELANEELNHKNIIMKYFFGKYEFSKDIPVLSLLDHLPKKENLDENSELKDVLSHAILREEKEYKFYDELEKYMIDPKIKEILKFLKKQERNHKAKLENMYDDIIYSEF
ncbi:MAG: ferritin-like domain-containing protein [Thermoplasmata archaeon]